MISENSDDADQREQRDTNKNAKDDFDAADLFILHKPEQQEDHAETEQVGEMALILSISITLSPLDSNATASEQLQVLPASAPTTSRPNMEIASVMRLRVSGFTRSKALLPSA